MFKNLPKVSAKGKNPISSWFEVKELDYKEDAEQLFLTLFKDSKNCFWLDSNRALKHEVSRFSFMGAFETELDEIIYAYAKKNEIQITTQKGKEIIEASIFDYLRTALKDYEHFKIAEENLPFGFKAGFVGYLGYELKTSLGYTTSHDADLPDAALFFTSRTVVFDHNQNKVYLLALTTDKNKAATLSWFETIAAKLNQKMKHSAPQVEKIAEEIVFSLSQNQEEYIEKINDCKQKIIDGESYEICLTNRVHTNLHLEPLNLYRFLRKHNPAPYASFLRFDDFSILSSSPEQFLKIKKDGWVSSKPIKGTIAKSDDPSIDFDNKQHLQSNEKDRAENLMIVDLLRNDLGKVCEIGSVTVPILMDVESYATLHQLVSTVKGKLKKDSSIIDCLEATFPGGSITGAPKIRTMEIIDDLEGEARGVYTGAIGYLSLDSNVELNIAIRTAIVTVDKITIGTGGAITFLSDPESEFQEIMIKAYPLIKTIIEACKGNYASKHFSFSNCDKKYLV